MNALTLTPMAKPLYQVKPETSHPRLSLRRVLWIKLLRWLDKASPQALWKTTARLSCVILIATGVFAPQFLLGLLTASLKWNGYKIPLFLALLFATINAKRFWNFCKRTRVRGRAGNQHSFRGIPVGELAAWLIEAKAFKRDEAIRKWGLSQGVYAKIAQELEDNGVLTRGENNARVLREITLAQLVLQLREKFPLVWSEERQVWAERNGTMERWALSHDFKQRKLKEETERKERKIERLDQKIQERSQVADILALCQ